MGIAAPLAGDAPVAARLQPLRLLWLIDSLTMGGAEALALSFARSIPGGEAELTVCSRTTVDGNPLEEEVRATGARVENLAARNLLDRRAFAMLLRLIREQRIEVIHAHLTYASIWASLAGAIAGVPVVATLHVTPPRGAGLKEFLRQRLLRFALNALAARVVSVSAALREDLVRDLGLRRDKLRVVHNGIELSGERWGGTLRESFGIGSDDPLVISVAVMREGKGIDVLISAAAEVLRERPEVRFALVGDGPLREEWRRLAESSGVAEAFVWTGFRRDVPAVLREADLFVHPTLADAFPTVLLEAMDAGLPIVASSVGGVPEIVEEGLTGRLVPPGDAQALAAAILESLRQPAWLAEAGAAARRRVEREFSIEVWVERLMALYREVAGERRTER
jgi:glycosyltransferase involved in cell wall biosynthesis